MLRKFSQHCILVISNNFNFCHAQSISHVSDYFYPFSFIKRGFNIWIDRRVRVNWVMRNIMKLAVITILFTLPDAYLC